MSGAAGGGGGGGGGGRAARALRLLLLLVMALAAVEYLFGSILDASPLRTYLYTPLYNATQPSIKSRDKSSASWPKRLSLATVTSNPEIVPLNTSSQIKNLTLHSRASLASIATNISSEIRPESSSPSVLVSKLVETANRTVTSTEPGEATNSSLHMPYCEVPTNLGPVEANKTEIPLASLELKYPEVAKGGWYRPPNCTARHRVAIIVPYRCRQQHLAIFLNHMHPFLMKQQIEYGIFVIEQLGTSPFNRAKLFNVGFVESNRLRAEWGGASEGREGGWQCYIFHDVDLLPLDTRNLYSCPRQPRHMSASIDKHHYKLLYEDLFGGVSAMTYAQFKAVNGFSNQYWGWGAEDDDMAYRLKRARLHIARYRMTVARYAMLDHKPAVANPKRYKLLSQTSKNFKQDGLSTLRYSVSAAVRHPLYTQISVDIDDAS